MVQTHFFWVNVPSGAATRCYTAFTGLPAAELSAGLGANPFAVSGTLQNMRVRTRNGVFLGANATLAYYVNGVASALSCVLGTAINEVTDNSTASITAGDTVELRITSGSSTGAFVVAGSVEFVASAANTSVYGFGDANANMTTTGQKNPLLDGGDWSVDSDIYSIVGTPGTITGYHVKGNAAPGAGTSRTWAIYKNTVVQDGSGGTPDTRVTMSDANTTASGSFSLSVVAGDKVRIDYLSASGSPASSRISGTCSFVATNPGCWNGGLFSAVGPETSESPPAYYFPLGDGVTVAWGSTTEADREMRNGPTPCWISNMRAISLSAPGSGGDAWVFKLRVNQADSSLACTISDAATSDGPDTSSVYLNDGDLFAIRWEELVTPGNSTGVHLGFQFSENDPNVAGSNFNQLLVSP